MRHAPMPAWAGAPSPPAAKAPPGRSTRRAWSAGNTSVIPAERSESRESTLGACMPGEVGPGSALRAVRDDTQILLRVPRSSASGRLSSRQVRDLRALAAGLAGDRGLRQFGATGLHD